jgi:hypothetical protein
VIIPPRYNGPPESANGGYACGLLSEALGGGFEVMLRWPPPLGVDLDLVGTELRQGDVVIAEARRAESLLEASPPVSLAEAEEASRGYPGFAHHAYPTCFTCGPAREDGLGIFAGPVAARDGLVAAPWTPAADVAGADGLVRPEFVWASLDCPGAFAVGFAGRGATVLGRLAARIDSRPRPGEPHVVVGWPLGEEGRKLFAGTALFSAAGEVRGVARAVWVTPRV